MCDCTHGLRLLHPHSCIRLPSRSRSASSASTTTRRSRSRNSFTTRRRKGIWRHQSGGGVSAGSPDIEESVRELPKWQKDIQTYGVEDRRLGRRVLKQVRCRDDHEPRRPGHLRAGQGGDHGRQAAVHRPADGGVAGRRRRAFSRSPRRQDVPIFSCSQHRYSPGFIGMRNHEEVGDVLGCDVYGGCPREPHHPDLVWHGIHGIETLYTIMGPGCVSVTRRQHRHGRRGHRHLEGRPHRHLPRRFARGRRSTAPPSSARRAFPRPASTATASP